MLSAFKIVRIVRHPCNVIKMSATVLCRTTYRPSSRFEKFISPRVRWLEAAISSGSSADAVDSESSASGSSLGAMPFVSS